MATSIGEIDWPRVRAKLLEVLEKRRWSLYELSRQTGIPITTIYREFSATDIKFGDLMLILDAVGLSWNWLRDVGKDG